MVSRPFSLDLPVCIIGAGGFARETLACLHDLLAGTGHLLRDVACFSEEDERYGPTELLGVPVQRRSAFDAARYRAVVAVGESRAREQVVKRLPPDTRFATLVHPSAVVAPWAEVGEGSIVMAGAVLTTDVRLGRHAHVNLHASVGHDCVAGDYLTLAPGARLSGECRLGKRVYVGTNAAVRQGLTIADDVMVGMGAVVIASIAESGGTYVGVPAFRLNHGR